MSTPLILPNVPTKSYPSVGDTLLGISNGSLTRFNRDNLLSVSCTVESGDERWIRIAQLTSYGSSCILAINTLGYSGGWQWPVTLMVTAPHGATSGTMPISAISHPIPASTSGKAPFSQLRISGREQLKYVDILMPASTSDKTLVVSISCALGASLVTPVENPTTLATVKVIDYADLWS